MSLNPSGDRPLYLTNLSKENPMADYTDPHNTAIKPSLDSLEGKMAALVTILTAIGSGLGVVVAAYPNDPNVKIAALVLATVLATVSAFVVKSHGDDRTEQKQTANIVAGGLALAEKARLIAKENPALAIKMLESAGVSLPEVPTPPAST